MALKITDNGYVPRILTRGWNNLTDWVTKPSKTVVRERLQTQHDQVIDYVNDFLNYYADTGVSSALVVTPDPAFTSYTDNMTLYVKTANACTGASTINVNGLGVKSIKKNGTDALVNGDYASGQILHLKWDGTNFQLLSLSLDSLKSTLTTQGDIIYASAASTPARLGKGMALQYLRMNAGATAPEWAAVSANGWETISTVTLVSNTAQVDFTSILGYKYYKLLCKTSSSTSSDRDLYIRINDVTTASNYSIDSIKVQSSTVTGYNGVDSKFILPIFLRSLYSDATEFGEILISNCSDGRTGITFNYNTSTASASSFHTGGGLQNTKLTISKISLIASADAILSGSTIILMGVK